MSSNAGTESVPNTRTSESGTRTIQPMQEIVTEQEKKTVPSTGHVGVPPDGGLIAWSVVLGAWCTSFCSFGWLNSVGIFQNYYETTLLSEYSASRIAWIPSLQVFFMSAMGPVIGYVFDRRGPREIILFGTFMHVFGIMMASISKEYYQLLLAQGICSAIGASAIFQPALGCVFGWFQKKRATALGVAFTGSSLGGVLFPTMITHLISEVGYGWAMRIAGFVILVLLAVANLTVRSRTKPSPIPMARADFVRPFRELPFNLVTIGFALLSFGIYVPINFLVVAATHEGMSDRLAQYLVAVFNASSLLGRIGAGMTGDKLGRYNTFIIACAVSGILVLALWIPGVSNAAIIAFAALFGFSSGAYISLSPALVGQISPMKEIGYRSGILFAAAAIPGLVTSPIAGAILANANGSYVVMKIYAGAFILVGAAVAAVTRVVKVGPKPWVKF